MINNYKVNRKESKIKKILTICKIKWTKIVMTLILKATKTAKIIKLY